MAHHFLHLRDGTDEVLDPEGASFLPFRKFAQAVSAAARELIAQSACGGEIDFGRPIDAERRTGVGRSWGSRSQ